MSMFSGKCDLFDHIMGRGGWFNEEGKPVKVGDPDTHVLYSDEMLDFIAFKKETGGVIHQHKKVKVDLWNQNELLQKIPHFSIVYHDKKVKDKRCKDGFREEPYYTYIYYNKEYTLKELNKRGVWVEVDIHFDTILDLIPYYPYLVTFATHNDGKAYVVISNESYVTEKRDDDIKNGYFSNFWEHYTKALQDHYRDIVLRYFDPKGYEQYEEEFFHEEIRPEDSEAKYVCTTLYPIDTNFPVEWIIEKQDKSHWTSPKVIDDHTVEMSKEDYEHYIGHICKIKYVKQREHKICLD